VLLDRFGSIAGLLEAGPDRWAEVGGIGAVRAHALAAALLHGDARDAPPLTPERRAAASSVP
jgi:hypothetical protein